MIFENFLYNSNVLNDGDVYTAHLLQKQKHYVLSFYNIPPILNLNESIQKYFPNVVKVINRKARFKTK